MLLDYRPVTVAQNSSQVFAKAQSRRTQPKTLASILHGKAGQYVGGEVITQAPELWPARTRPWKQGDRWSHWQGGRRAGVCAVVAHGPAGVPAAGSSSSWGPP